MALGPVKRRRFTKARVLIFREKLGAKKDRSVL